MGFSTLCRQYSKHNAKAAVYSTIESQRYFKHNFVTLNNAVSCWGKLFKSHSTEVDILKIKLLSRHSGIDMQSTRTKQFYFYAILALWLSIKTNFLLALEQGMSAQEGCKSWIMKLIFHTCIQSWFALAGKVASKLSSHATFAFFNQVSLSLHPLKQDLWKSLAG